MIKDPELQRAVTHIMQRSEKQRDLDKLEDTFEDVGIRAQVENDNNQIIYGRRGTGKTHLLKVLAGALKESESNVVVYIDARTLGSTAQFSDTSLSIQRRCTALFRDLFGEINNALLEHLVKLADSNANAAYENLSRLGQIITSSVEKRELGGLTAESSKSSSATNKIEAGPKKLAISSGEDKLRSEKEVKTFDVSSEDKVIFPELHGELKAILEKANILLYVLLDEWSSLPRDLQPYLAEFLRRSLVVNPSAILKIGALEYRSNFGIKSGANEIIGFEVGGDISTTLDLDDYYVFDRNPQSVFEAFSNILYRHISSELPGENMKKFNISGGADLASRLLKTKNIFEELVRASEGVVRDLINIFTAAFFDSLRRGLDAIDKRSVVDAARQWYEKDKSTNLDSELQEVLRKIISEVIGHRKARSFLLKKDLEKHPVIQKLFDLRVLHLMQRGYADKDNPGIRYNIYTLDYGTYVDLINTSRQPDLSFGKADAPSVDIVIPFDDKRSIRRIILPEDILTV